VVPCVYVCVCLYVCFVCMFCMYVKCISDERYKESSSKYCYLTILASTLLLLVPGINILLLIYMYMYIYIVYFVCFH